MSLDIEALKQRARALYGTACTQIFCQGSGRQPNCREVHVGKDDDIKPLRVDDGYLVTITVFVPDEEA